MKAGNNTHTETITAAVAAGLLTAREARNTVADFDKPSGERCPHQRHGKGCMIYHKRPFGCRFWNCRWLGGADDTADLHRPDRAHYVIDVSPDFVRVAEDGSTVPVVQVWVDPDYPDAHHDPRLRAFLIVQARKGLAALIRLSSSKAFVLAAPPLTEDGVWREYHSNSLEAEHTAEEKIEALGPVRVEFAERHR